MTQTPRASSRVPRWMYWAGVAVLVIGLLACGGLTYWLVLPGTPTARIRDMFLVLLALEGLIIGLALLALSVEIGLVLYILYREIMPILESLQETGNTVRGTASFLSDKITGPVVRAYGWLAAVRSVAQMLRPRRGKSPKASS